MGIRAQTAAPVEDAQDWDGDVTPLPEDPREAWAAMNRRVKTTGRASIDRVDLLRSEVGGDVREVNRRIDELSGQLAQVAASTGATVAKLDVIMADRQVQRQETSAVLVETTRAEIEIRKSRAIAEVDEGKARREYRRGIVLRVIAGVGAVWGTISALLLARGC